MRLSSRPQLVAGAARPMSPCRRRVESCDSNYMDQQVRTEGQARPTLGLAPSPEKQ